MKPYTSDSNHRIHPASIRAITDRLLRDPTNIHIYTYRLNLCNNYMYANKLTWKSLCVHHAQDAIALTTDDSIVANFDHHDFTLILSWLLVTIEAPPVEKPRPFNSREETDETNEPKKLARFIFHHTDALSFLTYMLEQEVLPRHIQNIDGKMIAREQT